MSIWKTWSGSFEGSVARIIRPSSLYELIREVRLIPGKISPIHAEGSRWAFSAPAYCEGTMVSTDRLSRFPAGLQDAINPSADPTRLRIAVESGIKVRNLYKALAGRDAGHDSTRDGVLLPDGTRVFGPRIPTDLPAALRSEISTNPDKWVLPVLGGAGGQSISGAINTGTHGGDVARSPLSDAVLAMLVVGDFGQLILIQPPWGKNTTSELPVVDVARLANNLTRELIPWWQRVFFRRRIEVIENHDEHMLNAAVVSVGRFGIVYAYVLEAHDESGRAIVEKRERSSWEEVRDVNPLTGQIRLLEQIDFGRTTDGFLQIVINPYTDGSGRHLFYHDP